ncbi:hypothetical protein [Comamonas aquatica]|uniref:hypothetical protein n=1 Tax=Comamonas aquatica TaxID=225991 RepID=UPI0012E0B20B|nr:hypothetical protein [Comamonas aquatica]
MAAQSTRVHTVRATATSPDLVKLHMQAVNSLERCKSMLLASEPMYLFAQQDLEAAQQAIAALQALQNVTAH